jgi:lipopolysaccharide transport system ATP-binding protein
MSVVLRVEHVSKAYHLGVIGTGTLHQDFERWWARVRGRPDPTRKIGEVEPAAREAATLWALNDVTFDVAQGTALGIIGPNGAGKSTLLKILARVTAPTAGCVKLRGRVASLLEIGTGFHPELTGRENVYLNGAILGMRTAEIARKMDEILAFAAVERFAETPVKRYSSGMYLRLAFAVAAHLDSDILIVDEVLAVGDLAFQKQCLGKIQDLTGTRQRTVLFVSHNMGSIKALCSRAVLLDRGSIAADGAVDEVVARYVQGQSAAGTGIIPDDKERVGTGEARFREIVITTQTGERVSELFLGQPFTVTFAVEVFTAIRDAVFEVDISTRDGTYVTTSLSTDGGRPPLYLAPGRHQVSLALDVVLFSDQYTVDLGLHHAGPSYTVDFVRRTLDFHTLNVAERGGDRYPYDVRRGFTRPSGRWRLPKPTEVQVQ